jgi:predicted AAA+ superfamily ATPase
LQHLRAWNDYRQLGYDIHYWRTARGDEVDFVLHGERGLVAFEVKMSEVVRGDDLTGLLRFSGSFKQAKLFLVHPGRRRWHDRGVEVVPFLEFASGLDEIL